MQRPPNCRFPAGSAISPTPPCCATGRRHRLRADRLPATLKGISKLEVNRDRLLAELDQNWEVLAEPIQTVMRRYGIEKPYEKLKELTRGKRVDAAGMQAFIDSWRCRKKKKTRLKQMTPANYLGRAVQMVDELK